jgi:DNA-binding MarR family transcriptional regulator
LDSAADILEPTDLLGRTERRMSGTLARVLERDGGTVVRWRVLALVADGAHHPMSEVIESAIVPAPTATRLIDEMTSEGLVRRELDPDDRRRVLVSIRPGGRALYRRLARRIEHERETLLASWDERELERLVNLLTGLGCPSR